MAQEEDEEEFANILLLLIPVKSLVSFEFATNIRQFFVYSLDLGFLTFTCKQNVTI